MQLSHLHKGLFLAFCALLAQAWQEPAAEPAKGMTAEEEELAKRLREAADSAATQDDAEAARRARAWWRGLLREGSGDFAAVEDVAQAWLRLSESGDAPGDRFRARCLLAWRDLRAGEAGAALWQVRRAGEALESAADVEDWERAQYRSWRFDAAREVEEWADAETQLDCLHALSRSSSRSLLKRPDQAAAAMFQLGRSRYAGFAFEDARRCFSRALAWAEELAQPSRLTHPARLYVALCDQELGRYADAMEAIERVLAEAEDPATLAQAHYQLGSAAHETGETVRSHRAFARALELAQSPAARWLLPEVRMVWARCLYQAGRLEEAQRVLAPEVARATAGDEEMSVRELVTVWGWSALLRRAEGEAGKAREHADRALAVEGAAPDDTLPAWLALARVHLDAGELAEAGRARDAALQIIESPLMRARGEAASYLRMRAAAWTAFDADLLAAQLEHAPATDAEDLVAAWWQRAQLWKARDVADVRSAARAMVAPAGTSWRDPHAWLKLLPDGAVLLDYVLGEEEAYVARAWNGGLSWIPLGPHDELVQAVLAYRRLIEDPYAVESVDVLRRAAERVHRLALGPCLPEGADRILVSPVGVLADLPFDALVRPGNGESARYADLDFVVRHAAVVRIPSPAVWALLATSTPHPDPARALVIADPAYREGRWPRLPGTRREAEALRRLVEEGEWRVGEEATPAALLRDLASFSIVHVAAHAVPHPFQPERSRIVLAPEDGEDTGAEAGELPLGLFEEAEGGLRADLAVLSACDTAQGFRIRGEGTASLARGFLRAGARSVVASQWPVHDASAAELMETFYRGMIGEGRDPADALRIARLHLLDSRAFDVGEEYRTRGGERLEARGRPHAPLEGHPYFWAPFVYLGAGLPE